MYGQPVTPVVASAATIAALPATGGSHNVVTYVAIASIVFGAVVLLSVAVRFAAKRYFRA